MRAHGLAVIAVLGLAGVALASGALSAAATGADPSPGATGSGRIGFTVGTATATATPTATPTPTPSTSGSTGTGSGGSSGGGGGSGGSGGGGDGGASAPSCTPSTTTPTLAPAPEPSPAALTLSRTQAAQGEDVIVKGEGFQAGEKVVIALYSSPVKLGVFTVRSTGQVYAQVTIPPRTQLGSHTVQVTGFQDCRVAAASVSVVSPRGSGSSIFPWIAWLVAGGGIALAALGILIAFLLGWLPNAFTVGVATRALP